MICINTFTLCINIYTKYTKYILVYILSVYVYMLCTVYTSLYYPTICAALLGKHCWNTENSRASQMTHHEQFWDFTKSFYIQSRTHCVIWLSWRFLEVQSEKGSWNWALAASTPRH